MKKVKDKAECWLNANVSGSTKTQLQALILLLKEQDRDTRHACANSVIQNGDAPSSEMIGRCHSSCINAVAI